MITDTLQGLTEDSRHVRPGFLFAALDGLKTKGTDFIDAAIQNGASTLLVPETYDNATIPAHINLIKSQTPRQDFAKLCAAFYKHQPPHLIGVTGTSGKTSVVTMVSQIWAGLGFRTGTIGTLGVKAPDWHVKDDTMTTPAPEKLFDMLARLQQSHVTHTAMEITSHALTQYRVDGVELSAAAFTNLSRDHLDYHGTMDAYFEAKCALFKRILPANYPAVIFTDDPYGEALASRCKNALTIGKTGTFLTLTDVVATGLGQTIHFTHQSKAYTVHLPLGGIFQAHNALVAIGLVLADSPDLCLTTIVAQAEQIQGIPGRLEPVAGHPLGAKIYVDYAHKPDGLEQVLATLRPHTTGRLVCLFGCGGDRDKGKRAIMGAIAAKMADIVIITDDNPRTENPAAIRTDILQGAPHAHNIADRTDAIKYAVHMLNQGDTLVIAGKGHETYQIIGDKTLPFSDAEQAKQAIGLL